MTDRELMQMALDALEYLATQARPVYSAEKAIEALRARLEKWTADDTAYRPDGLPQAEQELVAWSRVNMNDHKEGDLGIGTVKWDASAPLVVHPHPAFQATQPQPDLAKVGEVGVWGERQWQGLTDEEIEKIEMSASSILSAIYLAEAQLKGKNAL